MFYSYITFCMGYQRMNLKQMSWIKFNLQINISSVEENLNTYNNQL